MDIKKIINNFKEMISEYLSRPFTVTYGDKGWRFETRNNKGKSDISLFADGKCIFKGSYGELVRKVQGYDKLTLGVK